MGYPSLAIMISESSSLSSVSTVTGLGLCHDGTGTPLAARVRVADSKDIQFDITVTASESEPTVST